MNEYTKTEGTWFDIGFRKHHPGYAEWLIK